MTRELPGRVAIADDVLFQKVGEEMVLLDLHSGIYFGLDPVGSRFWSLLGESGSVAEAYRRMLEEYEVDPDRLEQDLKELVRQLEEKGLITVER